MTTRIENNCLLCVENKDATPEELESHPLNREKVIADNGTATIYVEPLTPRDITRFSATTPHQTIKYNATLLFGTSDAAANHTFRMQVEYEF